MFYITSLISLMEDCWQYMSTDALGKMPMGSSGFRAGPGAQRQLQQMPELGESLHRSPSPSTDRSTPGILLFSFHKA